MLASSWMGVGYKGKPHCRDYGAEKALLRLYGGYGMKREDYPYMHTFWHHKFRVGWPLEEDVCIEDIAHSLSLLCRFTGHVKQFYSVGEHSVRVSYLCPPEYQLWGLLHDAGECYAGDVNRPLKYSPGMEAYREYE